jgi:sugar phosphate isomerase/epimerase
MLLLCSGPDTAPDERPAAFDRFADVLSELCEHAARVRPADPLWITLEHFDRELDQRRLVGPTVEAAALVRRVRQAHPNIGLTLDLSHLVQLGEDIDVAVEAARDVVVHAHVANCGLDRTVPTTFGDSHCRFGAPGGAVGVEDVAGFLRALVRCGYGASTLPTRMPLVSVEMKTPEGEPPELAIAAGLRMLKRAALVADAAL